MSDANALHSLYGGAVARKALAGNVAPGGDQAREQTVLTPSWFVRALELFAGPGFTLDPCTTPQNPVGAAVFCTGPLTVCPEAEGGNGCDGLQVPWHAVPGLFYCNPPYADLEDWLRKARQEHFGPTFRARGYLLAPFRPQRAWFCSLVRGLPVVTIRPLVFQGHKQGFPAPLCVVCYGLPVPQIRDPKGRDFVTGVWSV